MRLINPELRIENTNRCNAKCVICPREKMTRPLATMLVEHFETLVDQAKELGATDISIFGYGEPLLDPDVVEKVFYCHDHNLKTFMTTNAALLTKELSHELIQAGLDHIRISAHGLRKETFESVHAGLNFSRFIQNVFNFIYANRSYNKRCKISISCIPMHGETVEEIKKYWESFCDYLEIWRPHNWTDGRQYREVKRKKRTCGRPFNGPIQINADGKIMVCCFDYDAKLTVGDTYRDSIEDIVKGQEFERIREAHRSGNLSGLICENCDQLNEYDETDTPLLYSNRDMTRQIGKTSSTKFKLED